MMTLTRTNPSPRPNYLPGVFADTELLCLAKTPAEPYKLSDKEFRAAMECTFVVLTLSRFAPRAEHLVRDVLLFLHEATGSHTPGVKFLEALRRICYFDQRIKKHGATDRKKAAVVKAFLAEWKYVFRAVKRIEGLTPTTRQVLTKTALLALLANSRELKKSQRKAIEESERVQKLVKKVVGCADWHSVEQRAKCVRKTTKSFEAGGASRPDKVRELVDSNPYYSMIKTVRDWRALESGLSEIRKRFQTPRALVSFVIPFIALLGEAPKKDDDFGHHQDRRHLSLSPSGLEIGILSPDKFVRATRYEREISITQALANSFSRARITHPISLNSFVGVLVNRFQREAKKHGLRLSVSPYAGNDSVFVDQEKLIQILDNLVENAIKFTPRGGKIVVSVSCGADKVGVAVSDTGQGMPKHICDLIIHHFKHGGAPLNPYLNVPGVGLAVIKELGQSIGAEFDVSSKLGAGSRFTVRIPRPKKLPRQHSQKPDIRDVVNIFPNPPVREILQLVAAHSSAIHHYETELSKRYGLDSQFARSHVPRFANDILRVLKNGRAEGEGESAYAGEIGPQIPGWLMYSPLLDEECEAALAQFVGLSVSQGTQLAEVRLTGEVAQKLIQRLSRSDFLRAYVGFFVIEGESVRLTDRACQFVFDRIEPSGLYPRLHDYGVTTWIKYRRALTLDYFLP